jgi:hydroxylamine oxidation protein HaoB
MPWRLRQGLFLAFSCVLLLAGSTQLIRQIRLGFSPASETKPATLNVIKIQTQESDLQGAFSIDSIEAFAIQRDDKDVFSLLLAQYQDSKGLKQSAVLFPKSQLETTALPSPTGLRQAIWLEAAKAIRQNTSEDSLLLSWWDDGQRIHFLSGRTAWLKKPSAETFLSPLWKHFQDNLLLATEPEHKNLSKMARWLTLDSETALAEMRQFFDHSQPIYVLVNNDLLMRVAEMADYGGKPLSFNSTTVPIRDNLHGDIAQTKRWAYEEGDGNYLVQKEGLYYHVWSTPKRVGPEKNSLLVRLLPFVDSLKKLPEGIHLVYQSNWGGYLSIYRIDLNQPINHNTM